MSRWFDGIRIWIASVVVYAGAAIAPKRIRSLFIAYRTMLDGLQEQMNIGRTYGVVTAIWALQSENRVKAAAMQDAGMEAMRKARVEQEAA